MCAYTPSLDCVPMWVTIEHCSAIKRNKIVPFSEMWMDLETVVQSEISQKQKNKYHVLMHIYAIYKNGTDEPICKAEIVTDIDYKHVDTEREKVGSDLGA